MGTTKYLSYIALCLLLWQGFLGLAHAQLTARDRFKLVPHLIPEDPGGLLLTVLPEVNRYPLEETHSIYLSKKENPLVVNQSWQDLAINYLLHGQYERSLECLKEAERNETKEYTDFKIFRGYAYAKMKKWDLAEKEWRSLAIIYADSYLPELNLYNMATQQYKFEVSTQVLNAILAETPERTPLLYHYMGIRHFQEGDLHQARVFFIKAHSIAKPNPWALLGLCFLSLTEEDSYDALGWLQRTIEYATIPMQRSLIDLPVFEKLSRHPDFIRIQKTVHSLKYQVPQPALEAALGYRYDEKFKLARLLEGGLKLRIFDAKEKYWIMKKQQ